MKLPSALQNSLENSYTNKVCSVCGLVVKESCLFCQPEFETQISFDEMNEKEDCVVQYDCLTEEELESLIHPGGRTAPVFYD
jgi:transcription initiation factor TFIIIB Brf1 subunit/transcription initiation factor TFIIB